MHRKASSRRWRRDLTPAGDVLGKRFTVISTYPQNGSQNIGDYLIGSATSKALQAIFGTDSQVETVWREERWETAQKTIETSDAVVFACLALRKDMIKTYPFLPEILRSGKKIGVLSAGTSLNLAIDNPFQAALTPDSVNLVKSLSEQALFFTTRGRLTQAYCASIGLERAQFSGDIAFFDERFQERRFETCRTDQKPGVIAISDPHYSHRYRESFRCLVKCLKDTFPASRLVLMVHGSQSGNIEAIASDSGMEIFRIYLDPDGGLDEYERVDLHIGYRVHGHVSALTRRKPSYLLEQDGRGRDYGLTIDRSTSISHRPSFSDHREGHKLKNALLSLAGRERVSIPNQSETRLLVNLCAADSRTGFDRFIGLENQLDAFVSNCLEALRKFG